MLASEPLVRIFAEIEEEHHRLTALASRLSAAQIGGRPGGAWSAIDTIIHITAWQEHARRVAVAQAAPDAPEIDPEVSAGRVLGIDGHAFNAGLLDSHRDWTLDQALAWHNQVHSALRAALGRLPSARLLGGPGPHGARTWYGRPAIVHAREHRLDLERRLFGG